MREPLSERFPLNRTLLAAARDALDQPHIFWILGGSASGKSTVAALLAANGCGIHNDLDNFIFDRFLPRYRPDRHPASYAWLRAPNPLAWVLSLSWPEFNALTRAADAEALSLLAAEPVLHTAAACLLDGGFAHPAVVAAVAAAGRMVCLAAPAAARRAAWEQDPGRAEMRRWIQGLPEPERKWRRFLAFDARQAETMLDECRAAGVPVVNRAPGEPATQTADRVAAVLGLHET